MPFGFLEIIAGIALVFWFLAPIVIVRTLRRQNRILEEIRDSMRPDVSSAAKGAARKILGS